MIGIIANLFSNSFHFASLAAQKIKNWRDCLAHS
jgi:hypothetical protein